MPTNLPPGAELDFEICTKVMRAPRPRDDEAPWLHQSRLTHKSGMWRWDHINRRWIPMPFSTNWDFASKVIEQLRTLGFWMKLTSPFSDRDENWWAGFTTRGTTGWNGVPDNCAVAETGPHAICLAAIAALEAADE